MDGRYRTQDHLRNRVSDTDFDTFSDSCVFPDHPRHRAAEHFVNLPRDGKGLISDECPTADKCVLSAILEDSKLLASQSANQGDRLIALKFLGHWVGDIHQPLHVSFEDDRGGNDIHVIGECFGNLRAKWNTCLVERALGKDIASAASRLLEEVTPDMITIWSASDPRDWANESFAIARSAQTGYCVIRGNSCNAPDGSVRIDAAYQNVSEPIVRKQLQKAGVRLARQLDVAFRKF